MPYLPLLLCLSLASLRAQPAPPPNVLMISVDDLNDYVGHLGGYAGEIHTPNIDRLAARGVAFTNAHVQAPLCGPSRASVMTGLRPSTTGVYGMIDDDSLRGASPALDDIRFLPEYFADHGYRMGEKGTFAKHCLWEPATRVPFLISGPGIAPAVVDQAVELLSLYPTLLELTGLPPYTRNEGQSLAGLVRGTVLADSSAAAITTFGYGNHAVRTDRYRYIRYEDGGEELYDHAVDPEEWFNLADDERYAKVIDRLKQRLPTGDAPWAAASQYTFQPYFVAQKARRLGEN